jgi:hypothetical protein
MDARELCWFYCCGGRNGKMFEGVKISLFRRATFLKFYFGGDLKVRAKKIDGRGGRRFSCVDSKWVSGRQRLVRRLR